MYLHKKVGACVNILRSVSKRQCQDKFISIFNANSAVIERPASIHIPLLDMSTGKPSVTGSSLTGRFSYNRFHIGL